MSKKQKTKEEEVLEGFRNLIESFREKENPPKPSNEDTLKEMENFSVSQGPGSIKVLEADDEKGVKRLEVKLIEHGWSKNGYFYSKEVAESVAHLVNNQSRRKMYMDHDSMFFSRPSRDLKEFAAIIVEAYARDGASYAIVESTGNPTTDWIFDLAKRHPKEIGASIDARAKVEEVDEPDDDEEKNRNRWLVKELVFVNSVDFVSYASAGGEVVTSLAQEALQIMESYIKKEEKDLVDTVESFREEIKALSKDTKEEQKEEEEKPKQNQKTEESIMAENTKEQITLESLRASNPEVINQIRKDIKEEVKQEFDAEKEVKDLTAAKKSAEEKVSTLESEKDGLQQELDSYKVKEAAMERRQRVLDLIKEHDLPEHAATKVFKEDLEKLDKDEDVIERIKDRKELLNSIEEGEVQGNGPRKDTHNTKEGQKDKLTDDDLVANLKA